MSETSVAPVATGKAALYAALARAQKQVRTAELDGRFDGGKVKYPFTSAQERMAVARDALGAHGLALTRAGLPELAQLTMSRELLDISTGETTVQEYAQRMLEQRFLLVHESGEALELGFRWPVMEGPGRPLDKAWAAADTSGLSYLIRDVLLIPSEEKDDLREREGSGGKIVQMPSRPAPPAPTAPAKPTPAPAGAAPSMPVPQRAGGPPSETPASAPPSAATSAPAAPAGTDPDVFDEAIAAGPMSEIVALEQKCKAKLAAAPTAAIKLFALQGEVQDKALWLEIFAVAEKRFGSRERTIAAVKELGVPQGTVPSIAQLRKFVEVMP